MQHSGNLLGILTLVPLVIIFEATGLEIALGIFGVMVIFGLLQGIAIGTLAACVLFVINYSRLNGIYSASSGANRQSHYKRALNQQRLLYEEGDQIHIIQIGVRLGTKLQQSKPHPL